ncbi:MAG: alkaline phosphatase PhoX [Bacteroidota bacterium]
MNSRRNFIKQSLAVSAGFSGLGLYLSQLGCANDAKLSEGRQWLELPEGFQANIISTWGDPMSDGFVVPGRADGMAAFDQAGKVVIVRNHENSPGSPEYGPFKRDMSLFNRLTKNQLFDYGFGKSPGLGGTTTLVYNEQTQKVEHQHLSLAGTYRNCAGGPTPWNSWITCEEDTTPAGDGSETAHGYNFEIPVASRTLAEPIPLKAMGRFNHEAVCVDPASGIVYQTEDRHDGLIYRFLPFSKGQLHKGGVLQALAIKGQKSFDTRNWKQQQLAVGQELEVEWIDVRDVESPEDDLRKRGRQAGAATFARGEGMWFGKQEVYFACTNGGKRKCGQVFKYIPSPQEGQPQEKEAPGRLVLFAEPNDTDILKYCDNLTVAPWGDVVLVEDTPDAYMRGITPEGKIYTIARNVGSDSELAGVCFSPSGKTLFVNIQEQGLTFAINGPWEKLQQNARG